MKKLLTLFAISGMLFVSSCGNKEVSEEATEVEVVIEEAEEAPEVMEEVIEDTTAVDSVVVEG
jgi:hypothetical protein